MTTLKNLFPGGPRSASNEGFDLVRAKSSLAGTFDAPSQIEDETAVTNVPGLVAMVDAAALDAAPVSGMPARLDSKNARRVPKRRDWLSVIAVAAAVFTAIAAGTLVAVDAATANPAEDSLRVLSSYEAEIVNLEQAVRGLPDAVEDERENAILGAEALRASLADMREVPNPRFGSNGATETLPVVNGEVLDKLATELDLFVDAVAKVEVPVLPESYSRSAIDESSLTEVAAEIDAAQGILTEWDNASQEVREARRQIRALVSGVKGSAAAFATRIVERAEEANQSFVNSTESTREMLNAAVGAVRAADLLDPEQIEVLPKFRDAFIAFVADDLRVQLEREAEERRIAEIEERLRQERAERDRQNEQHQNPSPNPNPDVPGPTPEEPGEGDTDPADPGTTDPSDIDPTDPGATDPSDP